MNCPCGNTESFEACCSPYIAGEKLPPTAEALMRSRYSAYVKGDLNYIKNTLAPESQSDFDMASTKKWAEKSKWKKLKIISTKDGQAGDATGVVEFVATYTIEGKTLDHHEVSDFRKTSKGQWLFVNGEAHTHNEGEDHHHPVKQVTIKREGPKIGRNDPCTCGSGKKYKKCCGVNA